MTTHETRSATPLLDLLFEDDLAGRCLVAPDGSVLRANGEWLRSTGFALDEVHGANIVDLFPGTRDVALAMHARARAGRRVEVPRHAQVVNGHETWWEGSIDPVPMDGGMGLLITAREVKTSEPPPPASAPAAPGASASSSTAESEDRRAPPRSVGTVEDVTERRRAQDALRESEDRLRRLYESGMLGVVHFDLDGAIRDANDKFLAMVGYTREDLEAGRVRWDLMTPPEYRLLDEHAIAELEAGGVDTAYEKEYIRKDGSRVPVLVGAATYDDARHRGLAFVLDITERRRAEEAVQASSAKLSAIVEQLPAAISVLAMDGTVTLGNSALAALGITRPPSQDPAQRPRWSAEDEQGRPVPSTEWPGARALRGEAVIPGLKFRHRHEDGSETQHVVSSVPLRERDGRQTGAIVVIQDVTRLAEGEQQRLAASAALEAANAKLREADRRKTEFLAVLSHELRNPLAPIRNGALLLERAPAGSDQARRAREIIHRQADHLTRLVDDLLDLTRITHGKIELQKTRLDARLVVTQSCDDARASFDRRGVVLRYIDRAEPLWVDADPARLAQMVGNVLANALKFTPARGAVDVVAERRGEVCEIEIRDTGIGIAREDLGRIFDAFEQAVAVRRAHGGLGIGLALVKDLAERHGGSIRAHSEGPGLGSSFVLTLPLAPAPTDGLEEPGAAAAVQPLSILIVEDNVDAATTLADLLALGGHAVEVVHTGREGVERARRLPDVLLSDLGLPDLTGHDVVRAVRALPGGEAVFAVALTGYAQPEDREAARAAGFDAHLAKPPPLDELQALLAEAARRRRGASGPGSLG